MIKALEKFFLNTLGRELCVLLCSVLPVIELRGAIPLGTALGFPWWENYLLSVIGKQIVFPPRKTICFL